MIRLRRKMGGTMKGHIMALACVGSVWGGQLMADPAGFVDNFKKLGADWHVAEYNFEHDMFDTDWRKAQVSTSLSEDKRGLFLNLEPHIEGINNFAGSSIRRQEITHYGRYEVRMKAATGPGVVTGFFTYTGPHYGTRHDEIDIEFLGRNTRQMHAAWFVDGVLKNRFIDLDFDAAAEMADYAFEWHPDKLLWFANDQLIFEHDARDGPIPTVPGRLFVNLWAADPKISNWAGHAAQNTRTQAQVNHVRFTPFESKLQLASNN